MAVTTVTPNMNLTLPVVGASGQVGPTWATNLNTAFNVVDSHNHSLGSGVAIPTSGININADLTINDYNVTDVGSLRLSDLTSVLTGGSDIGCIYEVNGDLYWNNAAGTAVQITSGSGINAASVGAIGGDYGTSTASLNYYTATKTFVFKQDATKAAKINCGDLSITEITTGGNSITIKAPSGLSASYTLSLPTGTPATTQVLSVDSSGGMFIGQVTTAQITDLNVTTAKIADANVTLDKIASAAQTYLTPTGSVVDYAGSSAPTGWLLCNGASVSRTTYADLFAVIGTTFGVGNGTTTFNLPDAMGRVSVGAGSGSGLTTRALGANGGAESENLQHNHKWYESVSSPSNSTSFDSSGSSQSITTGSFSKAAGYTMDFVENTTQALGTMYTNNALSTTQSVMNPFIVFNKIIKY